MRIAHFTDIHVTESPSRIPWRDLTSKRLLGWINLRFSGRSSDFRDAGAIAAALAKDLSEIRPDGIVSTGDLTGLSLGSEFAAARSALGPLVDDPRVTGIPGNHDVYVRQAVRDKLYEQHFGAWTRTDLTAADFPENVRGVYPYPLVRRLDSRITLICLRDSVPRSLLDSSGRVGDVQLAALDHVLAQERSGGRTVLLALHYALCRWDRSPDGRFHGLRDAARLIEMLSRHEVSFVLHGHLHGRFVLPPEASWPFSVLNPGSLASRRAGHVRAYHVIHLEPGSASLEARRFDDERGAFVPWPDAPGAGLLRRA